MEVLLHDGHEKGSPIMWPMISTLRDVARTPCLPRHTWWNVNIESQLIKELLISLIIN